MPKKEIQPQVPGNINPGPELRASIAGADICESFFKRLKLIDYLTSINAFHLHGEGKITGPIKRIASEIPEQPDEQKQNMELFHSWGGTRSYIEWKRADKKTENTIFLGLFYSTAYEYYQLYLQGTTAFKADEETPTLSTSFHRKFMLNPLGIVQEEVDDILLTFTNELVQSGIL